MGLGDNLMATGFARGAKDRGKRIAFGDGKSLIWDQHSAVVFLHNPNIAAPGTENDTDVEWFPFYKGRRIYNRHDVSRSRWIWNYEFKAPRGEMFFTDEEEEVGASHGNGFVVIEPGTPQQKSVAVNKQWPAWKFASVAKMLDREGVEVRQFIYPGSTPIPGVKTIKTKNFRFALATIKNAGAYVGPEGGLHHGSAAVGTRAVVLFGGFIPPAVTGYDDHINLTGGAEACGSLRRCHHCINAMNLIKVDEVFRSTMKILRKE